MCTKVDTRDVSKKRKLMLFTQRAVVTTLESKEEIPLGLAARREMTKVPNHNLQRKGAHAMPLLDPPLLKVTLRREGGPAGYRNRSGVFKYATIYTLLGVVNNKYSFEE